MIDFIKYTKIINKLFVNLIIFFSVVISVPAQALDKWEHKDWVCYIDPFDLNPENRINILGSLGFASRLHVKKDGKTLLDQNNFDIKMIKNIENMRNFGFSDGTAMAVVIDTTFGFNRNKNGSKMKINGEWHPALYVRDGSGGYSYRCKPVSVTRD
tara:strand:- start:691 stop:1158 length:468 start_codon:yes stop_codon:yes gene_type:complete